jgi:hypothetical protein
MAWREMAGYGIDRPVDVAGLNKVRFLQIRVSWRHECKSAKGDLGQ